MAKYCTTSRQGTILTFAFTGRGKHLFDVEDLSEEMQINLLMHGLKQKLSDSFASAKDSTDPTAFAEQAVSDVWQGLVAGTWNPGKTGSQMFILAEALSRFAEANDKVLSTDDALDLVRKWEPKVRAAKAKIPVIAKLIAEITLEGIDDQGSTIEDVLGDLGE